MHVLVHGAARVGEHSETAYAHRFSLDQLHAVIAALAADGKQWVAANQPRVDESAYFMST